MTLYKCLVCGHTYGQRVPTPIELVVHHLVAHEHQKPIVAKEH